MKRLKCFSYGRDLVQIFPRALVQSIRLHSWRGAILAVKAYLIPILPISLSLPGFGCIRSRAEVLNYLDNFCFQELRCSEVEQHLKKKTTPVVIDLGVNVGISMRWWFFLNPKATVVGIDMLSEALQFSDRVLADINPPGHRIFIESGVGAEPGEVDFAFDDALNGESSLKYSSSGATQRRLPIDTLDHLLQNIDLQEIDLIKLDIEGFAGMALLGGEQSLTKTRYVVIETHDPEETFLSSRVLSKAGFQVFRIWGRTMWWVRGELQNQETYTQNALWQ